MHSTDPFQTPWVCRQVLGLLAQGWQHGCLPQERYYIAGGVSGSSTCEHASGVWGLVLGAEEYK